MARAAAKRSAPQAIGVPGRAADLDALPGFRRPPPGYGQVPFYWWVGDPLTRERLAWQLDRLAECGGITGLQINYAHGYRDGGLQWGLSLPSDPPLFSEPWWDLVAWFMAEAKRRGWSISLSDYTLGPGQGWCFDALLRDHPDMTGAALGHETRDVAAGPVEWVLPPDVLMVAAYPLAGEAIVPENVIDLRPHVTNGVLRWNADTRKREPQPGDPGAGVVGVHASACPPATPCWRLIVVSAPRVPLSLDPLHPDSGRLYAEAFFGQFDKRFPGEAGQGLNFFFSDELNFNVRGNLWTGRFAAEFQRRKGYDLVPELPALFLDCGPRTAKIRLDYRDVMVALEEEAFFAPVFDWHQRRGMIYGCDHGGRGRDVIEFGDYFRTQRWNQGPGCDQPHLACDLIKNKVASSIAHLYLRPRVWLEGYYGSGWGTATEGLTRATFANFAQGQNLLSLHGLYYTTHGGFWEWAPPCNHFRMPYWPHMKLFLEMVQRLSYLLSQGCHRCDVAILYPVAPMEAGLGGDEAVAAAFDAGRALYADTIDFDFMDFESLDRAEIAEHELRVGGERYRVLVLPAMRAIRWNTLTKALAFHCAGGLVLALGALPEASDRAGAADPELDSVVRELFGNGANTVRTPQELVALVQAAVPPDFAVLKPTGATPNFIHRRIGPREVYMVHGVPQDAECLFRAVGTVELWDPWTGDTRPLPVLEQTLDHTRLRLPLSEHDAQLIVFTAHEERRGKPFAKGSPPNPLPKTFECCELRTHSTSGEISVAGSNCACEVRQFRKGLEKGMQSEPPSDPALPGLQSAERVGNNLSSKRFSPTITKLALSGEWEFELVPTLDNRFGDFRWPPTVGLIGAEARRFRYMEEPGPNPGWEKPEFDDSAWPTVTHGFGPKFWKLGPLPADADLDTRLAGLTEVNPNVPIRFGGVEYHWQPYAFSWRWGVEGDPGRQGWHGLKENVSDDFIILGLRGKSRGVGAADYEYLPEPGGTRYYLWTAAVVTAPAEAAVRAGGDLPAAAYVNGESVGVDREGVRLQAGTNALLLRYDRPGRGHFVLEVPTAKGVNDEHSDRLKPGHQQGEVHASACPVSGTGSLAMGWYTRTGVVPFEVRPAEARPAGWYRFTAPPGLRAFSVAAYGQVRAWVDGREVEGKAQHSRFNVQRPTLNAQPSTVYAQPRTPNPDHRPPITWDVRLPTSAVRPAVVTLRVEPVGGEYAGAAIPEPITLDCGSGRIALGDWSGMGALECYSGGAWYRKNVSLTAAQAEGAVTLDLGQVVASAEVRINGQPAGVRVAPPWEFDLSPFMRAGENRLEILVYSTLANHYLTIPTAYRGESAAGLFGPVTLAFGTRESGAQCGCRQ